MSDSKHTVTFDGVEIIKTTDEAALCKIDDKEVWIPQSQIDADSEVWEEGDKGSLVITEWIAMKKKLV